MKPTPVSLTRRRLLRGLAFAGGAGVVGGTGLLGGHSDSSAIATNAERSVTRTPPGYQPWLWSDPRSWPDGRVPGRDDIAVIDRPLLLEREASVAGVTIEAAGALVFSPHTSTRLRTTGNVIVAGMLSMQPTSSDVQHVLVFDGVNESRFRGDGSEHGGDIPNHDVGLWVVDGGQVQLVGAEKTPWTRTSGAVAVGADGLRLEAPPTGWQVGDELQIVPTLPPTGSQADESYDGVTVASLTGDEVALAAPTRFAHPQVDGRWTAEVLNLSRNVRIEGTPGGRAHVHFSGIRRPQTIRNVALRHLGPRRDTGDTYRSRGEAIPITEGVVGRYALHFHRSGDGSRGTLIENTVAVECGNHVFVAHESHGITFRGCVAHDTWDGPFWWDQRDGGPGNDHPETHDTLYDNCVASLVRVDPPFRGRRLTGFSMIEGSGNAAVGCVAVGVLGGSNASGFGWPEGSQGVWLFEDCIAHNNATNGIFVWQNTRNEHVVERFVAYHNGQAGIEHGAYRNSYKYRDCRLFGNGQTGVVLHATGRSRHEGLAFEDVYCDGGGFAPYAVEVVRHRNDGDLPTRFSECHFEGFTKAALALTYDGSNGQGAPSHIDVVRCRLSGNEFWLDSNVPVASHIRVQDSPSGAYALRRVDQQGELIRHWNARRTRIDPFD